jgi:hypothetical protein
VKKGYSPKCVVATMALLQLVHARAAVPLMTVLGPLMVAQYAYWRRRGRERTTRRYLEDEPTDHQMTSKPKAEPGAPAGKPS